MLRRNPRLRSAAIVAMGLAFLALPACGGGSDDTQSSGPVAKFTADTPTPPAGTIALLPGGSTGASVNVRVTVTGVDGFFGAAFRVTYDTSALLFRGMDDSGSFLRTGVTNADVIFLSDHVSTAGVVVITATRKDPAVVPPVDVVGPSDLVVLNFTARKQIAAAAPEGRLDFADPKQVCDGTLAAPACGAITVTWSGGGVSAH
ncbi:MAG TPA: cohesin domain-containing protein [Candidatus Polarisedimenticolaceae bacterium]|nr:cohesin domain-containing protein [Candidatus Polarisedimenticolaceae bacterium]